MDTNEYLRKTQPEVKRLSGFSYQGIRPGMVLGDGTIMSVQASDTHYSAPRMIDLPCYSAVEVGYPSIRIDELMQYAEDADNPTETVYGYVPVEVIDDIARKHGGIVGTVNWVDKTRVITKFEEAQP